MCNGVHKTKTAFSVGKVKMKIFLGVFGFGVLLLAAPIAATAAGVELPSLVFIVLMGFGVVLSLIGGIAMAVANFYVKSSPNMAFVRDGMGGIKTIYKGGAFVIGAVHSLVQVPLSTIQLVVSRRGSDALITSNNLRADITAEFYIKVPPDVESIENAATSLGDVLHDSAKFRELIEKKLVSALRTVAAKTELQELHSNRDAFMKGVMTIVMEDLKKNGLTLESATISHLDQTPVEALNMRNVFDAQGAATIAQITEEQLTMKNDREKQGLEERRSRDVEAAKKILEFDQDKAEATASQNAAIKAKQSQEEQKAEEARIGKEQAVQVAEIKRQQAEEVAEQERQKAVEVKGEERRQAKEVAEQKANQAKEVAEQDRVKAVFVAQKDAADAETARQNAEAEAEKARQSVQTVTVTETARRDKEQRVIAAEAEGQERLVKDQKAADASAYTVSKEAEGRRQAAEADAEAITKKAEAEAKAEIARADAGKTAAIARAEGKKAEEMIPVDVEARRVEVKAAEVEVDKSRVSDVITPELEARAKSGQVAQEFELGKLRINMELEVGKAAAIALGDALSKADMQLFGTPEDAGRMIQKLGEGMGVAQFANGVVDNLDPEVLAMVAAGGKVGLGALGEIGRKFGFKVPQIEALDAVATAPENGKATEASEPVRS